LIKSEEIYMFEKLSNSWRLVKASAQVLQADKELMLFPAVSSLALILVSVTFFIPMAVFGGGSEALADGGGILGYVVLFLFYVVQYSVIFFFNSALVGAAMIRLEGGNPTVSDGFRIAKQHLKSILAYAVIAATVGMFLRMAKEKGGPLSKMVTSLVGLAWNLATFLVVPVLVTKNVGPVEAIKESAAVLKRTWGEQVVGNAGIGFVFTLLFIGLTILFIPVMILVATTGQLVLIVAVVVLFVLLCLGLALVNATLSGIYSAALYRFATAGESSQFDQSLLQGAFRAK
jgi:hypothetical protein